MKEQVYLRLRRQGIRFYLNSIYPVLQKRRVKAIGKKNKIEVVFFAINVAMWRYQGIYDLLSADEHFNCHIVLTGARQYSKEQRHLNLEKLRDYFNSKNIDFFDFDENNDVGYDVKGVINPDILFYPQPYEIQYVQYHSFREFLEKLICYIPYTINVLAQKDSNWIYNALFHNIAWKLYYPFSYNKLEAVHVAQNHGRNVVVSGYPNLDTYLSDDYVDVWKIKDRSLKRLIWAPHFSMPAENNWITRSNFLWMSDLMLKIAEQYKDRLQIAFKPHPWLRSTLYKYPEWGKEKTDSYFEQWDNMTNTFVAYEFVDLFKSSDAMIHDSASFTAEYLYLNKPVAFVTTNLQQLMIDHSEFGRKALKQHYIVGNNDEVWDFINNVVLRGNDTMLVQRTEFYNMVLKPNTLGSTSEFIVNDIKKSLGLLEEQH